MLFTAPFTDCVIFSKPPSSPVTTSNNSLDASLAVSAAPAKSPEKNFKAALPNNPNASKPCFNLSINPCLIAVPKSLIDCIGSLNIPLKNSMTVPTFASRNLKKSLNAKLNTSKVVLKASATFWF